MTPPSASADCLPTVVSVSCHPCLLEDRRPQNYFWSQPIRSAMQILQGFLHPVSPHPGVRHCRPDHRCLSNCRASIMVRLGMVCCKAATDTVLIVSCNCSWKKGKQPFDHSSCSSSGSATSSCSIQADPKISWLHHARQGLTCCPDYFFSCSSYILRL